MLDVPNLWKAGCRRAARGLLSGDGNIIINPEVFHRGDLERTLDFIRRDLLAPKPHKGAAAFNQ